MPSKADCRRAVESAGVSPERAAALVDFVMEQKALGRAQGAADIAARIRELAQGERLELTRQRRNEALTIIRRDRLEERAAGLRKEGLSFERAIMAATWGDRSRAAGARDSAARLSDAHRDRWSGKLARELDKIPGLLEAIRKDKDFDAAVRREMIAGESLTPVSPDNAAEGGELVKAAAKIFSDILEDIRTSLNEAGANIGRLDGYAPQNHDAARLLKAGQGVWVARMLDELDWDRTFAGLPAEERAQVLSELWTTIVTGRKGRAKTTEANPFRKPDGMAAGFEHERSLHFKDAAAAAAYHAEFGRGTVLDAVVGRIERAARAAGMMETFGPNPETMIESLFEREALRLRNLTPDEIRGGLTDKKTVKELEKLEKELAGGNAAAAHEWDRLIEAARAESIAGLGTFRAGDRGGKIGAALKVLLGETGPESPGAARFAAAMRGLRQVQALSSLGSAVIAAIGDIQTKALWFRHGGENIFESLRLAFSMKLEGLQTAEKKEIGRALGFYADSFLDNFHARFTDGDAGDGWLARNVNRLFKLSGLNAWTEAHKASAGFYLSRRLADNAGRDFAGLDPHYAATLRRAGLEDRWELIRKIAVREEDGQSFILPENAEKLTDEDIWEWMKGRGDYAEGAELSEIFSQTRRKLELDLLGYIHDETGYAVIEPDARTAAVQTLGGQSAGTAAGEAARAVMQFKSFPVAYFQRILSEQRWLKAADAGSAGEHAGGLFFSAAVCAVMGYISITARDLSRGREPRDPRKLETVAAAIVQGGGLSIWGDFFLGKYNRWGGDMLASAAGPTAGTLAAGVMAGNLALKGEVEHGADALIRLGMAKMPYANLWWAKSALDYGLFFHLREWMSPGTLARSERALKRDFNQQYLKIGRLDLRPSANIKKGGGFK